jgi:hypothetical protein
MSAERESERSVTSFVPHRIFIGFCVTVGA